MKRFTLTEFFLALQEASQNGIENNTGKLKDEYDKFASLVFSESMNDADKSAIHDALMYTGVELEFLTSGIGKKNAAFILKKPLNLLESKLNGWNS